MMNTSDIAKAIGQQRMAVALDVGLTAVNNAVARGYFPASWYAVVSYLARQEGIDCPDDLFRLKSIDIAKGLIHPCAPSTEAV